jgi:outer membrane protein TolC
MSRMQRRIAIAALAAACAVSVSAQQAPRRLTLNHAVQLALKNNLSVLVAGTQVQEAGGTRQRASAALLPRLNGTALANLENRNLAVAGLSVPGIPMVVGPFSYYDFGIAGSQSIVNLQAYHSWKASRHQEEASRLDYQDARDLVIRQTAGLYLASETAFAEVQASQSRVTTSEALEKLARDQHDQGLATGIDVVRAQVQLARDQQTLLAAQNSYQTSLLALARFLGLPPGTPLELAGQLEFHRVELPDVNQAIQAALLARPDYRSLLSQRGALVQQQKASHARYYPTLSLTGDYGALGRNFGSMPGIGEVQATLSVTLFDRDRRGEQKQLASRVQRIDDQLADLARGIDEDVRKAELDIQTTSQQVTVAEAGLALAERELQLAEDRFRNGVTDNIEVVTAQTALDAAQDSRIASLAQHADAVAALVRALGATEQNYQKYLGETLSPSPGSTTAPGEQLLGEQQ